MNYEDALDYYIDWNPAHQNEHGQNIYGAEWRKTGKAEGVIMPSRFHSKENNRGWHFYNVNGYLGSINKRGEYFIVKSREDK